MRIHRAAEEFDVSVRIAGSQQLCVTQQMREMAGEPFIARIEAWLRRNIIGYQLLDEGIMRAPENDGIEASATRGAQQSPQEISDIVKSLCATFNEASKT